MASIPSSAHLQAFEAVARRRSFALAASELHLTASAVSHQVAKLEAQLGVRLFERSAHGVRLSRPGQAYLERVGGALAAIVSATEDLRHSMSNSLYVHCAPSIASLWLMPRLRDFARACPHIALNLSAAHSHSDFALGQADIDIRYGIAQWPELEVEPLFEEHILPLASPAFVAEHGLQRVQQLLHVPLIQSNVSIVQWSDWFQSFSQLRAPERFAVRFDRAQMSLDAATQGLGVALESAMNAGGHIADGRLVAPFGVDRALRVKAHFAVYPARNARRPAVAAFLAWLHAEAARTEQQPCRQSPD
ncbi:bacterial regulatory helix-turn-helix, lysR family protein [Delftia acidovorans]|uniref:LysR substrate-binding domain-containing protein n=1 Tax=Delftia acidovorans TaxID=80866 RepID=A0AAJ2QX17_DELAC|nr:MULTISPECIES: LysR substrate-binding domain-containing protein [Delftia]PIF40390.1 DNA-binding transcriptional LysR family regulator [Burkholderiales bacterium 23]ATH12961.1 LysR family transcriptional regulator [Delftia acidovorans]KFJ09913.1 bacterial regulatory helix-turn-helix, lysR family protein [Delftia acidovorans]MCB4788835.1 LysR family transcriptional regulator [Delftia sp. Lp-1]MCG8988970.1 LysR substrate-binding domain-containing protein [Delftia acidovorans]